MLKGEVLGGLITTIERPLYDCPEPCACYAEGYAAGKDKAYFEILASLEGRPTPRAAPANPARSSEPACRRCLRSWPRRRPRYSSWWEVWALGDHDGRSLNVDRFRCKETQVHDTGRGLPTRQSCGPSTFEEGQTPPKSGSVKPVININLTRV